MREYIVISLVPDVPGWDPSKGQFALTSYGDEKGVTRYSEDNLPPHTEVFTSQEQAIAYCIANPVKLAAIPVDALTDDSRLAFGLGGRVPEESCPDGEEPKSEE